MKKTIFGLALFLTAQSALAGIVQSRLKIEIDLNKVVSCRKESSWAGYVDRPFTYDIAVIRAEVLDLNEKALLSHSQLTMTGSVGMCDELRQLSQSNEMTTASLLVTARTEDLASNPQKAVLSEEVQLILSPTRTLRSSQITQIEKR